MGGVQVTCARCHSRPVLSGTLKIYGKPGTRKLDVCDLCFEAGLRVKRPELVDEIVAYLDGFVRPYTASDNAIPT
jgi:transcription elongation factor Elf1